MTEYKMTREDSNLVFKEAHKALELLGKKIGKRPIEIGFPLLMASLGVMVGQVIGGLARDPEHAEELLAGHAEHVRAQVANLMKEEVN